MSEDVSKTGSEQYVPTAQDFSTDELLFVLGKLGFVPLGHGYRSSGDIPGTAEEMIDVLKGRGRWLSDAPNPENAASQSPRVTPDISPVDKFLTDLSKAGMDPSAVISNEMLIRAVRILFAEIGNRHGVNAALNELMDANGYTPKASDESVIRDLMRRRAAGDKLATDALLLVEEDLSAALRRRWTRDVLRLADDYAARGNDAAELILRRLADRASTS